MNRSNHHTPPVMPIAVVRAQMPYQKVAILTTRIHRSEWLPGSLRALIIPVTSTTARFGTSSLTRDKAAVRYPQKDYKEYRTWPTAERYPGSLTSYNRQRHSTSDRHRYILEGRYKLRQCRIRSRIEGRTLDVFEHPPLH